MGKDSQRVLAETRRLILSGAFEPGGVIQPKRIADEVGSNVTAVREALIRLVPSGLVNSVPNIGFRAPKHTPEELEDILQFRCATEKLGAQLALSRGDLEWESSLVALQYRLQSTPRRLADHPETINPDWEHVHLEFHQHILAPSACAPLMRTAQDLSAIMTLYRNWAAPSSKATQRDVNHEHDLITKAALAHDGELLSRYLREHYTQTLDIVLDAMRRSGN